MNSSTASAEPAAKQRAPYGLLIAMAAIGPLAMNMFVPSMPGLQSTFQASSGVVQMTLTVYLAGLAICQLIYGPLSDRYGRRPMLLAGLAKAVRQWTIDQLADGKPCQIYRQCHLNHTRRSLERGLQAGH